MGKKLTLPPPRSECGQWPFDKQDDVDFQEFVIGETPEGYPVKSTCDPDALDNRFGSNPGAHRYLTAVFFKPEVLDRYYSDPKFEVRDGYLACLRVPFRGGDTEFGDQVKALHRLLVESINTPQLKSELPVGGKDEKSIALLERWLDHKAHQQREQDIGYLGKINNLRNVSEHRAGSRRQQVFEKYQIADDRREAMSALFEEAISLLDSLGKIQARVTTGQPVAGASDFPWPP